MKYNELVIKRQKKTTRVGRGISAGKGKTAGRGTKGQGSRKSPVRAGFEGGQMPLYMRLPKLRGFKSHRDTIENVYTDQLDKLKKPVVDAGALAEAGLISNPYVGVKLIQRGEVKGKFSIRIQAASAGAIAAIEKAGGTFETVQRQGRPAKKSEES